MDETNQALRNGNIDIIPTFSPLAAQEVLLSSTFCAINGDNLSQMTIFRLQWRRDLQVIYIIMNNHFYNKQTNKK